MSTTATTPTPDLDRFASIVETAAQHMAKHDSVTCFGPLADLRWPERDLYRARVRAVLTAVGYAALCERADAAVADRDELAGIVERVTDYLEQVKTKVSSQPEDDTWTTLGSHLAYSNVQRDLTSALTGKDETP